MNKSLLVALGLLLISPAPVFARAAAAFSNQNIAASATANAGRATAKATGTCNFKQMIEIAEKNGRITVSCIEGAIHDLETADRQKFNEYQELWKSISFNINGWLRKELVKLKTSTHMIDWMIYLLNLGIVTNAYYDKNGNEVNENVLPNTSFETYHRYLSHADLWNATPSFAPGRYEVALAWLAHNKSAFEEHPSLAGDILIGIRKFKEAGFSPNNVDSWALKWQQALHKDAAILVAEFQHPDRLYTMSLRGGGSGSGDNPGTGGEFSATRGVPGGKPGGADAKMASGRAATGRKLID